jgi:hypothetical protein
VVSDWQCVADNATQEFAIDASNWEAKHLVCPGKQNILFARAAKETGKA